MDYELVSVNGGIARNTVNDVLQTVTQDAGTSTLNLTLPRDKAGDYVVGQVYTLSLTAKK